jgi:hypothetical protein
VHEENARAGWQSYELPVDAVSKETIEFYGKLLGTVDNDGGDRPRWAELRLYKAFSEESRQDIWLLYTIGHTLVYHRSGRRSSRCQGKGETVNALQIPAYAEDEDNLDPCVFCNPPDWEDAADDDLFDLELTWYTPTPCSTAERVYNALRREARCANCTHKSHEDRQCWTCECTDYAEGPRTLSIPGRKLWDQARAADPEIAKAAVRKVRL